VPIEKATINVSNYEKSLNVLEDLHNLAPADMKKIVEQAMFYITNLPAEFTKKYSTDKYQQIIAYIESLVQFKLKCFYRDQKYLTASTSKVDFSCLTIKDCDRLISGVQEFFQVAHYFEWIKDVDIQLTAGKLTFRGQISKGLEALQSNRPQIYALYRKLFKKKSILVYDLNLNEKNDLYLTLCLDFSHSDEKIYQVNFGSEKELLVGFSHIFPHYSMEGEQLRSLERHLVVEISRELKIDKTYRIKEKYFTSLEGKEILHFPFLFRPVSLIIPERGKVIPVNLDKFTGSGEAASKLLLGQDDVRYIDFFSLMSD